MTASFKSYKISVESWESFCKAPGQRQLVTSLQWKDSTALLVLFRTDSKKRRCHLFAPVGYHQNLHVIKRPNTKFSILKFLFCSWPTAKATKVWKMILKKLCPFVQTYFEKQGSELHAVFSNFTAFIRIKAKTISISKKTLERNKKDQEVFVIAPMLLGPV